MSQPCLFSEEDHLRQRNAVWLGLSLAIFMVTASQLCWKAATLAAGHPTGVWATLIGTFRQPLFLAAIVLYLLQFFNWMWVLSNADLSYAQPITALSYVTITAMAKFWFNEALPPQRLAGIALILAGVWFISRTGHRTLSTEEEIARLPLEPSAATENGGAR